jgi:uracil-DNA glycosylase family 4
MCGSVFEYDERLVAGCKDCTRHASARGKIVPSNLLANPLPYVVVGTRPGRVEVTTGEIMSGETGRYMIDRLERVIPPEVVKRLYLTNVIKCGADEVVRGTHRKACSTHLWNELYLLGARVILTCGEATTSLLQGRHEYGKSYTLRIGNTVTKIIPAPHFATAYRHASGANYHTQDVLDRAITVFWEEVKKAFGGRDATKDHRGGNHWDSY